MVVTPFPSISQTNINIHKKKKRIDPENHTFFEEMFFQTNFQAQLMAWSGMVVMLVGEVAMDDLCRFQVSIELYGWGCYNHQQMCKKLRGEEGELFSDRNFWVKKKAQKNSGKTIHRRLVKAA